MAVIVVTTCAREEMSLLERAWGIIANANHGDWAGCGPDWEEAAYRWRDEYHRLLDDWVRDQDRYEQEVFGPY